MSIPNKKTRIFMTPSWDLVALNFRLLQRNLEAILAIVILPALTINLGNLLIARQRLLGFIVLGIGVLWWIVNISATYYLQVAAVKGQELQLSKCYSQSWRYFWRIIGFNLFLAVLLVVGLILLIVPGLIVLRRYILTPYYMIDGDISITQAMKESANQTKPISGYIWGTIGVIISISLAIALISELFSSIPGLSIILNTLLSPLYYFMLALRYREVRTLKGLHSSSVAGR